MERVRFSLFNAILYSHLHMLSSMRLSQSFKQPVSGALGDIPLMRNTNLLVKMFLLDRRRNLEISEDSIE